MYTRENRLTGDLSHGYDVYEPDIPELTSETPAENIAGYYGLTGEFISREDILLKKAAERAIKEVVFETPLPTSQDYKYWMQRFKDRQAEFNDINQRVDHAVISFPESIILNFIGDTHIGAASTAYQRLEEELDNIVNTPFSYVVLMGDMVDAFFFNAAQMEQMEQTPEQYSFMQSILKYLGDNRKLLAGFGGDHDGWAKKMGVDMYHNFSDYTGAYYMQGVGYITAKVGEVDYNITAAHRLPGYSMYNVTHPQNRAVRFGSAKGSDIVVSGHTHQKGISRQWIQEFGGETNEVNMISLGTYKASDEYSRKLGYSGLQPEEMFGVSVILNDAVKEVTVFNDILKGHEVFKQ